MHGWRARLRANLHQSPLKFLTETHYKHALHVKEGHLLLEGTKTVVTTRTLSRRLLFRLLAAELSDFTDQQLFVMFSFDTSILRVLLQFLGRVGDRLVILLPAEKPLHPALIDKLGHVCSRGFVPGPYPSQLR